ncbi:MAG: HI0074 family nucleotidyltransferase substrate-binding subunit [Thermodesulfobacteriota bacterium]
MTEINYDKFRDSLARLQERYNDYLSSKNDIALEGFLAESIQESCIQRFETCFDTTWKHLKKYLEEEGIVEIPNSPKSIFRIAAENKTIEDAESWIDYVNKRIATSHDYCGDKADTTLEIISDFITDAIGLYETMSGRKWEK